MPGIVVVGAQWGDEGKGKVVLTFQNQYPKFANYAGDRFAA